LVLKHDLRNGNASEARHQRRGTWGKQTTYGHRTRPQGKDERGDLYRFISI